MIASLGGLRVGRLRGIVGGAVAGVGGGIRAGRRGRFGLRGLLAVGALGRRGPVRGAGAGGVVRVAGRGVLGSGEVCYDLRKLDGGGSP